MQHLSFRDWLIALRVMTPRFTHIVPCQDFLLFERLTECYSIVCIPHLSLIFQLWTFTLLLLIPYFKLCSTLSILALQDLPNGIPGLFSLCFPPQSLCSSVDHEPRTMCASLNKPSLSCLPPASSANPAPGIVALILQDPSVSYPGKPLLPASWPWIFLMSPPTALCRWLHRDSY